MPPWPFNSSFRATRTSPTRGQPNAETLHDGDFESNPRLDLPTFDHPAAFGDGLEPPAPPFAASPAHSSHLRSLSGSLFARGRKKTWTASDATSRSSSTPGEAQLDGVDSPRRPNGKPRTDDTELEKGNCATCASLMQWPKGVTEYRCVTCLMVNDLDLAERKAADVKSSDTVPTPGRQLSSGSRARVPPISLERTKAIIDHCIDSYLQLRKSRAAAVAMRERRFLSPQDSVEPTVYRADGRTNGSSGEQRPFATTPPSSENLHPRQDKRPSPSLRRPKDVSPSRRNGASGAPTGRVAQSQSTSPRRPSRQPPPPPSSAEATSVLRKPTIPRKPVAQSPGPVEDVAAPMLARDMEQTPVERSPSESTKAIFKPLEEYITLVYASHDSLNCSFLQARPAPRNGVRSEDNLRTRANPPLQGTKPALVDPPLSELDAKTLLLGDVAENGMWWTGKDTRAKSVSRRTRGKKADHPDELVHPRSPQINWPEVHSWYRAVVRAGCDWRQRSPRFSAEPEDEIMPISSSEAEIIDTAFTEARVHVQRTLIKAAERLLKRPGIPLKSPNDIRFLLILIANPLLYPPGSSPLVLSLAKEQATVQQSENSLTHNGVSNDTQRPRSSKGPAGGFWEQGLVFGIIKRALGLLSNLSSTCHRFLTSWFARYDEVFLRQLLTLIHGFVTHRLGRQHKRKPSNNRMAPSDLIPSFTETGGGSSAQLHAAIEHIDRGSRAKPSMDGRSDLPPYSDDWQLKAAARIMAVLFTANKGFQGKRQSGDGSQESNPTAISRNNMKHHGQLLSTSDFYNIKTDYIDLAADFGIWESSSKKFSFCQYPFFLSVGSKIRIMELDSQRQMEVSAREAFFDTLFRNKSLEQYLLLKVRRDCLVEDSLVAVDEAVAQGPRETKKPLKVQFVNEPGIDAGGIRKEWFLLLVRDIFDPLHGMFIYDDDSRLCYFNPHSFETSNQYFLVGALLGFAIYNLTILDVALPSFVFKKLLASSAPSWAIGYALNRGLAHPTLDDLHEYRPALAKGLRQLLEYDGDVQQTFCRDFVVEVDRYGGTEQIALCPNGENIPVTNSNRQEFVDLYVRYLLDTQVARQFEPFKRGFLQVCGGNALSLFQPEEIELLIRGADEPLDVPMLKAVATYANWRQGNNTKIEKPEQEVDLIQWFWEFFEQADMKQQRRLLGFITGSDRVPATGASSLVIKIGFAGDDHTRFPVARTCFNLLLLYRYQTKQELVHKLWRAVCESEGFGLE